MMLGLIRPNGRQRAALRPRSPARRRSPRRRRRLRRGAGLLPLPERPRQPRSLRRPRRRRRGRRIEEVLEIVELSDRAKDRVGGYSHGMRQRLGIAAALLRRPRLLLLDEPATGLDPGGMRDMRDLIRDLAGQGITVLLSSHLLAEVEELCNRVAIVRDGRVAYQGSLAELRRPGRRQLPAADQRRRARPAGRRGPGRDRGGRRGATRRPPLQGRRRARGRGALAGPGRVGGAWCSS